MRTSVLKQLQDLDEAIETRQTAAKIVPKPDDFDHITLLQSLQSALIFRIHILKHVPLSRLSSQPTLLKRKHLDDAITCLRELISLTTHDDPNRPSCFNNLVATLQMRHTMTDALDDLDESILMCRSCLEVTPDGSEEQPGYVYNLVIFFSLALNNGEIQLI